MKAILISAVCAAILFFSPTEALAAQSADFTINYGDQQFPVDNVTLTSWQGASFLPKNPAFQLAPEEVDWLMRQSFGTAKNGTAKELVYSHDAGKVYDFVLALSQKINTVSTEPALEIQNGRAVSFTPPQDGKQLDVLASTKKILEELESSGKTAELVVSVIRPRQNLADLNNLGIKELVAQGVSSFKGSPKNRRHNIQVGVEKMKGIIVEPGSIFSFNEYLGEVDGEHGFLPELVIKKSGTVPEFGGGLCQVSSTTFRAAMQAGLPIKERRNHAYAVQYYAPQGTDATIYPGVVDLKFLNDSPSALLIWPYLRDKDTLVFDFYGTKDSRTVELKKPIQYDRKADGSMKAEWTRVVTKDGVTSTSTFKSVYQSPALFHKQETFPANVTPTPDSSNATSTGVTMPVTQAN